MTSREDQTSVEDELPDTARILTTTNNACICLDAELTCLSNEVTIVEVSDVAKKSQRYVGKGSPKASRVFKPLDYQWLL